MVRLTPLVAVLLLLAACSSEHAMKENPNPEVMTVAELLSSPSRYRGGRVALCGVARIAFEGTAVYESLDLATKGLGRAVWIEVDPAEASSLHLKQVEVIGVFTDTEHGHMDAFDGEVNPVEVIAESTACSHTVASWDPS